MQGVTRGPSEPADHESGSGRASSTTPPCARTGARRWGRRVRKPRNTHESMRSLVGELRQHLEELFEGEAIQSRGLFPAQTVVLACRLSLRREGDLRPIVWAPTFAFDDFELGQRLVERLDLAGCQH